MEMNRVPDVLTCDVGNHSLHVALIRGEEVIGLQTFRHGELTDLGPCLRDLWQQAQQPCRVCACSVNQSGLKALEAAAMEAVGQDVLVVGRDLPLPIDTSLAGPESVGTDRLCAASAAFDRLGVACVVADFGTAITIDCVDEQGVFVGGAILPGLRMGAKALNEGTAQLPPVVPMDPDWVIGGDTRQAIIGGLVFGARGALRELVEAYASHLGHWPPVIATGGDAEIVCPHPDQSELVQAVVPDLVLRGVAMSYYRLLLGRP